MKHKVIILMIVLLVVSLSSAYAGNDRRIGTAGAQELRIPVGSRGTAMGGSVIADVSGVEAIYWNPAGLAYTTGTEAMFSHQPYLVDIDVNFAGAATTIEDFGTIAAAVKVVSIGDMEETTDDEPDGTGRIYSPTMSVLSLSYSRILTNRVVFGITGKVVYENIFDVTATGTAFDIGFIYNPDWRGLKIGMVIKNYGPEMRFSGRGFETTVDSRQASPKGASFDLPSSFNLGISYDFINQGQNLATVSGNFVSNNYSLDLWQGGAEYVYDDKYALRAGYNYSTQDSWLYGLSLGAGVKLDFQGTTIGIDYSWTETEDVFDANQYITLKVQF
ncbi:MAG: PorV/PorQ family protein [FCB group bacterium]|nr:PorV/PorQ family protein [FCB group bacterium]